MKEFPVNAPGSSFPNDIDTIDSITVGQDGFLYFIVNRQAVQFQSTSNGPIFGRIDPANNNSITFITPTPAPAGRPHQ